MKNICLIVVSILSIASLRAQENFVVYLYGATVVPPVTSASSGQGWFTLESNVVNYAVAIEFPGFFPTGAGIYGPAAPGENGPLVFDWPEYLILPPAPGDPGSGGFTYLGGYILTDEQASQLRAGLWYVLAKSAAFPDGELRGQICPDTPDSDCDLDGVPEEGRLV